MDHRSKLKTIKSKEKTFMLDKDFLDTKQKKNS